MSKHGLVWLLGLLAGAQVGLADELVNLYSNALQDTKIARPEEICGDLTAVALYNTNLAWRVGPDGTSRQVRVVSFMTAATANNYYSVGHHELTGGEPWITLYPELRDFNARSGLSNSNLLMRMNQVLGLPPTAVNDTVVEFYIDPVFLVRPAPDPEINDASAGLVLYTNSPYLTPNANLSTNYVTWFNAMYDSRNYDYFSTVQPPYTNIQAWPCSRLGYTYDWAASCTSHVGLAEYAIPVRGLFFKQGYTSVPIDVVTITNAIYYKSPSARRANPGIPLLLLLGL